MTKEMKKELMAWFEKIKEFLPNLPFENNERNNKIREEIIMRLVSQFLTDDERAKLMGLPKGCRIREGAKIIAIENLKIGEYCWIGENAILDASGGLTIGSHTSIGLSVFIWTHTSYLTNLSMQNYSGSDLIIRKPTSIGNGCFIAGPSVIAAGSKIGDFCIVQPFSFINGEIPDRSIVTPNQVRKGVVTDDFIKVAIGERS